MAQTAEVFLFKGDTQKDQDLTFADYPVDENATRISAFKGFSTEHTIDDVIAAYETAKADYLYATSSCNPDYENCHMAELNAMAVGAWAIKWAKMIEPPQYEIIDCVPQIGILKYRKAS